MAEADCVNQHLEMMIHKRTRCENWVASIVLQEEINNGEKRAKQDELNFDEFSEISFSDDSVRRRIRKTINYNKSSLNLICEWRDCDFLGENARSTFTQHVINHVTEVNLVEKMDNTYCYQCAWESCNFESYNYPEIKRHICYHAYHTILKAAASELHKTWDFQSCKLDNENRNWLPNLSSSFECNAIDCCYKTDYYHSYLDHVNTHVNELDFGEKITKEIPCFWKGCSTFKCRKKTRLKLHVKTHTGEKTVACPNCGAMFATNTKYMDHCTRKAPSKDECNRCQYCFRYFSNERLLRDHMRYHVNSHKCSFCEITCSTPAVLANHVRYKHLVERPFKCQECLFMSVKIEDFNEHMSSHDFEPKFQCQADECNFTCRAVMSFKRHFKTAHLLEEAPIYCCHLCDRKYNRGTLLGNHLLNVHKLERPPGHSRFRYMEGIDGNYRLQVERYESLELNNANIGVTAISDPKHNFVLKREKTNEGCIEKFTVCYDENINDSGTLIAIDEMDEQGRVIRTSTVREEMSNLNDIVFVDVNNLTQIQHTTNDEQNIASLSSKENKNLDVICSLETGSKNVDLHDEKRAKQSFRIVKPRRKRKKILTDNDCISSEILIHSER